MRTHFYDFLANAVINPKEELLQLCILLSEERLYVPGFGHTTLEDFIDKKVFRGLSFRGGYIDIFNMRRGLKMSENDFCFDNPSAQISLDTLFLFSEFLMAIFSEGEVYFKDFPRIYDQIQIILENIAHFVEKTNHCLKNISKTYADRYIIVEKNKLANQAVEVIEEQPVALAAIEYNHYALRGDLPGKQAALLQLANYVEPILHSDILKNNGYAKLQTDTGFVLNNLHIRHNNKTGTKRKEYTANLSDKDLEAWYDRAYSLMLSVIVAKENVVAHSDIEQLKSQYKW